jgi:hypothetical protein
MLDVLFALDRGQDIGVMFGVDEAFQPIPPGEALDEACSVLPRTLCEIAGHANIENAMSAIRHEIDPSTRHRPRLALCRALRNRPRDGRVKPGHDGLGLVRIVPRRPDRYDA